MEAVTITEASCLLKISRQRILQLIYAQRVKGACEVPQRKTMGLPRLKQ